MVKIQIDLTELEDKTVDIYKLVNKLKTKEEAFDRFEEQELFAMKPDISVRPTHVIGPYVFLDAGFFMRSSKAGAAVVDLDRAAFLLFYLAMNKI